MASCVNYRTAWTGSSHQQQRGVMRVELRTGCANAMASTNTTSVYRAESVPTITANSV